MENLDEPDGRRSLKRKLELEVKDETDPKSKQLDFSTEILQQVSLLNSPFSDRTTVNGAAKVIAKLVKNVSSTLKNELMDTIVRCGVVPVLVKRLQLIKDEPDAAKPYKYEALQKRCAFILNFLARKRNHRQLIIDAGALPYLIDILKRHKTGTVSQLFFELLTTVAKTIYYLAHQNTIIMTLVRMEGGIPPLVELLEFNVAEVQTAVARVLQSLASINDDNKKQIVECNALPALLLMLQLEDHTIRYTAVGVIKNLLVLSSPDIVKDVLQAGPLQPLICLLSSCCFMCQSKAALILGLFATPDSDCKVHISQRGAIPPLVDMLKSPDAQLQRFSAFALWRLAQDFHNQAGIVHSGGIEPLLNLLDSDNARVQRHASVAIYLLAHNEDIVADIIMAGGFQKLRDGHFRHQHTKDRVANTLNRLEKIQGQVLKRLIYLMRFAEKAVQRTVAIALAYLCSPRDRKTIFIDNNGLELLLDILESPNVKQKGDASAALHKLAARANSSVSVFESAPLSTTPRMYLGEEYVNNAKLSDVTFLVEGRSFYAHRDCLLSSDKFQAMFDVGYSDREDKHVVIPNIKWDVFELMMRFIYTGKVDVNLDIAQDLLRAADEYLLDDLKLICENAIAQDISVENVSVMYKMSEDFNATALKQACILFMLEKFDELSVKPWYCPLVRRIAPDIRMFISTSLTKSHPPDL